MIVGATERERLAERVDAYRHSDLNKAHLILAVSCSLNSILLNWLGVSGHVNPFIAGDILLENLV